GAGGPTGSGGILAAAQQGIWVIGVDQDEYFTTFAEGETPGVEYLISSALKRVDSGVYDLLAMLAEENYEDWPGGEVYILDLENGGIGFAEKHDADIPDEIYEQVSDVLQLLIDDEIDMGIDPITGALLTEEDMEAEEAE